MMITSQRLRRLPIAIALLLTLFGGAALLTKADRQARDTTRKHHIQDLEQALYFARALHGTYPPYDQTSWCGVLNDPQNRAVRDQVETALRAQHDTKYANPNKPLPADPRFANTAKDYFYWKHSPSSFELYSVLEADPTGEKTTRTCPTQQTIDYDYGITSVLREEQTAETVSKSPL